MSPNEFIMNARLKYAAELLRNHPELQITEIAYQAGFSSLRYFGIASKPVSISHHKSTEESEKSRSAIVAERDSLFDTLSLLITCFLNFILFFGCCPFFGALFFQFASESLRFFHRCFLVSRSSISVSVAFTLFHSPRVKSGNATEAQPLSIESSPTLPSSTIQPNHKRPYPTEDHSASSKPNGCP